VEPGSRQLAAQVKAEVFNGRFNSGLGGFFSLAMDSQAFSGELVWFAPLLGEGKQSWEHFVAALSDSVSLL
jgi:hypothetical protein